MLPTVALLALLAVVFGSSAAHAQGGAATGRADVRLVRLLAEVPDSIHARIQGLHDLRVRLVPGNVLVLKKGGEFAALLPIEQIPGRPDSLRYFYYLEKPAFLWVIAGARSKGILTVPDGGNLRFNSFRLVWGREREGAGWIYFPEGTQNSRLRFSVVSGQSVDRADPKDTRYWVELGPEEKAGF